MLGRLFNIKDNPQTQTGQVWSQENIALLLPLAPYYAGPAEAFRTDLGFWSVIGLDFPPNHNSQ